MRLVGLPSCCKCSYVFLLTLGSLFPVLPHSTVAGPPIYGPVPEPSLEEGRGMGGTVVIATYMLIPKPQV